MTDSMASVESSSTTAASESPAAPPRVSVVICSHNGSRNLPTTLAALARNALAFSAFELVIVDSASSEDLLSTEDSRQSVTALDQLGVAVRIVRTERPGLTIARIHGVQAARADVVCFLDDDNEIRDGFLDHGIAYFDDDRLGVLVSRITPRFDVPPPASNVRRPHLLSINDALGNDQILWEPDVAWCPTLGAGLWVRKAVFLMIYSDPPRAVLADRTGKKLVSGGDIEIGIWAGRLGYRRVYAPDVRLDHHIPVGRLQTRYFLRLIIGVIRSQATLSELYRLRETRARWWQRLRFPAFILAATAVAMTRRDWLREFAFIIAAEFAECLGPLEYQANHNASRYVSVA